MGFANSVIGGAAALIRAAIKSPNFVTGSAGWQISKDGSAEFNNLTLRGVFDGTNFIINANGLFVYNGAPAKGTLILAIAENSGVDGFGNNYGQGFNIGVWSAATGNQLQHFGIDNNGKVYVANTAGSTVTYIDSTTGALLIYTSAGQAAGTLAMSLAPQSGTDSAGNTYPFGMQVGQPGASSQIKLLPGAGGQASEVQFSDPTGSLSNSPNLAAGLGGAQSSVLLSGPARSTAGIKDWVQFVLFSNNGAGTQANMQFNYINNSQVASLTAFYNGSGWTFQVPVTMIAGLAVTGGLTTDTLNTSGNAVIGGNATIGNGVSLANLTLSPKMAIPPNIPLSGSSTIAQIAACVNAIVSSMQNHGMMT